ncbi:MAG TPA: zf-HC2 domain-containing protein, partial [bacterium]|nr:zf-HC2 domain-containing protein [bacterium]
MKPCPKMQLAINLYHAGELDDGARLEVERHLERCPACREAAEQIGEIARLAAEAPGLEDDRAAASARRSRLMAALTPGLPARQTTPLPARPMPLQPLYAALAAMLLVAFGFLLGRFGGRQPAPDPTLQALLTGFQPVVAAGHTVQPELVNVQRVRYDPASGQFE